MFFSLFVATSLKLALISALIIVLSRISKVNSLNESKRMCS